MSNLIELNVRKALLDAQGSVTIAAELLRVPRPELTKYVAQRSGLQDFIVNLREEISDDCHVELGDAVDAGSPWAVKYTLKTIGANRGYGDAAPQPQVAQTANSDRSTPDNKDDAEKEWENQLLAHLPEAAVADALEQAKGHVAQAAKALGVPRAYVRKVIRLRPNLQMALFQEREKLADRAEYVLRDAVKEKKPWAIVFVLNTLGRSQGFGRPAKPSRRARLMANAFPTPIGPNADEVAAADFESLNQSPAKSEEVQLNIPLEARLASGAENLIADEPVITLKAQAAPSTKPLSEVLNRIGAELASKQQITACHEPVARNAPCPCNSGMKFKRCCGR